MKISEHPDCGSQSAIRQSDGKYKNVHDKRKWFLEAFGSLMRL
jgi:hypothetical protein